MKNQNTPFGAKLNLRGKARQSGVGLVNYFKTTGKQNLVIVLATIALFVAVYQWNSWFDAMLYNRMKTQYTTLQYELMKLLNSVAQQSGSATASAQAGANAASQVTPATVRAAATIATMLPIICLYPFLQRYFVTGLTIGGVKE